MSKIFELAASLGDALKEDERLLRLERAKKAYDEDPALQKAMVEYALFVLSNKNVETFNQCVNLKLFFV